MRVANTGANSRTGAGITAWGACIARHRIAPATIAGRKARDDSPQRALAWADEDCITLGVEAARRALAGRDRSGIGLVIFASTTHPFAEKQGAALIAQVLGLPQTARTADVAHSLRGGVEALHMAQDAVRAGSAKEALVIVSDCRQGAPGSELERSGGDAAVAFVFSTEDVVAQLTAQASETLEIIDAWRRAGDRFTHGWEDRFVSQHGIEAPCRAAAGALPEPQAPRLWAFSAPNRRLGGSLAKAMGGQQVEAAGDLLDKAGFCGTTHAPLLLAAALDAATNPCEVALVAHGDGAEAQVWHVIAPRPGSAVADTLADAEPVLSGDIWRAARGLGLTEYAPADDQGIPATIHFRERQADNRLQGQRCECGEPQFPKGRVCIRCGTKDSFTPEDFAERGGALVTYTLDAFFPSPTPPTAVGVVQVDNGPRIYMQVTDLKTERPKLGMRLRFAFRRIHTAGQRPNYFWKAIPERAEP